MTNPFSLLNNYNLVLELSDDYQLLDDAYIVHRYIVYNLTYNFDTSS